MEVQTDILLLNFAGAVTDPKELVRIVQEIEDRLKEQAEAINDLHARVVALEP